jgi:uncharacterized protein YacL
MKMKLDLKKMLKLMIAVILSFPIGNLFKNIALDKGIKVTSVYFFPIIFMGVVLGIVLGLFILPFFSDLLANRFLFTKLTLFKFFRKGSYLLDSSSILDGRIYELIKIGLFDKTIFISSITIDELNRLKNTSDIYQIRVNRGFETIDKIKNLKKDQFAIINIAKTPKSIRDHILDLSTKLGSNIITLDSSITEIGRNQKKKIININELSIAFRAQIHPKEQFEVLLTKQGKEMNQAVGYLDDGIMVVVEEGKPYINKKIVAECTSILQSNAGKILFAKYIADAEN